MSCCKCLLISEECFRATVPNVDDNVTFAQLQSAFRLAHDRDIAPLIGQDCADRYCAYREAPPVDPSPEWDEWVLLQTLVAQLQDLGSWAVYVRYLESFPTGRAMATGIKFDPDGSNPFVSSELKVVESLKNVALDNYNFYVSVFNRWLDSTNPSTSEPWRNSFDCLPTVDACSGGGVVYRPPVLATLGCNPPPLYPKLP